MTTVHILDENGKKHKAYAVKGQGNRNVEQPCPPVLEVAEEGYARYF
jgi:hypothetical protein